ncbi:energy transducer TonB [Chlorogloeopsis sp. ULAP02]|uniref:energy transducer TonB n=1 Tax=Chlorogloeopsis sp. ULAP02 TaxID=3107926 RepID=UPI0031349B15
MSVSSVAGLQREKEAKALKSFLTFSIVGSLMLHIGVLASGIVNLLTRVPDLEEEPIELTFVEPETPETPEPPKEPVRETKVTPIQPPVKVQTPLEPPVKPVPQPITPAQRPVSQPVRQDPPVAKAPQQPVEPAKPTVTTPQQTTATNTTPVLTQPSNNELSAQLRGIRDSRSVQESVGVSEKPVATSPSSTVTFGTRTGSGERRKRETFATAPTPPRIPTESNRGSGDGRAACRECNTKYPEQARRRGVEGRVEVAVDTDDKGNVTNVRLTRSSGNRQLDEAHLRQARDWKLKPSEAGRQGVTIGTEYAIQGSRRYRNVQEQKKRRQIEQRNRENVAAQQRRQRLEATSGSNTDVPTSSRRRRRLEAPAQQTAAPRNTESGFNRLPQRQNVGTTSPTRTQTTTPARQRLRESLRQTPQNNVERNSASTSQPNQIRRRRRQQGSSSSNSSANRLRDALRRNNQPSAPASTTPTTPNNGGG